MKTLFLLLVSMSLSFGVTHEVHQIRQAHSLHGTDIGEDFKGEVIQARVSQFPVVVVGALPESLIDAVAAPHQMPGPDSYKVPEVNLLVLCGIELTPEMTAESFEVTFDLSKLKIPDELEMSIRTILELSIKAVRDTLDTYCEESKSDQLVKIKITGTNPKNATLKNLAAEFHLGK